MKISQRPSPALQGEAAHSPAASPPLFEVVCADYEGSTHWLVSHEEKTIEEFVSDCRAAVKNVGAEYIKNETCWVDGAGWTDAVVEELVRIGYTRVEPVATWMTDSVIIDRDQDNWRELVGEELYRLALEKNKELDNDLWGAERRDEDLSRPEDYEYIEK
jgi:hypothetical protein